MVGAAVKKLKRGKAAGPSGIIAEMLRYNSPILMETLIRLTNTIKSDGKIPSEWDLSYIINCYKGKGDSMACGNYRGLKLLDQGLKVVERVIESILRTHVNIDSMQFGFMPGRGTTDPIFILRQLHEKYSEKKKDLYFLFIDLEKAFDRVPRSVIWWALRKLSVPEWLVRTVQAMYADAKSAVRINSSYSAEFNVTVGVHQGSVLSPLLFIIVMEALSQEFRTGCPWELLYADDLGIVAESLEELTEKFRLWKQGMEAKGLRVNMTKTKFLHSQGSQRKPHIKPCKYPCGICRQGVGSNSIYCMKCKHWIHKSCSGIKGRLKQDPSFLCRRCKNELPPSPVETTEFIFDGTTIDTVPTFCYLGDTMGSAGGCHDAITVRIKCAWKSFRELLPILTNSAISPLHRGGIFSACVRRVMLHASETWPITVTDSARLVTADNAMVRWMCKRKIADRVRMSEMHRILGIKDLESMMRTGRLRWYGHLERQPNDVWPNAVRQMDVDGRAPRGRPRKRWSDCVSADMSLLRLKQEDAQDRVKWRTAIRQSGNDEGVQPSRLGTQRR